MTKLSDVASTPPTPPPRSSLLVVVVHVLLYTLFWSPIPQAHAVGIEPAPEYETKRWLPPVPDTVAADLLRPFVAPEMPWSAAHRGIDIRSSTEEIIAPAAGEISFVGQVVDRPVVTIRHPNGLLSSFEPVETELEVGSVVGTGDRLGTISADSTHCEMQCVHWGVRISDGWQIGSTVRDLYIDPAFLLGWSEPSILWPVHSEPAF